jgi:nucleoside-diphosphate-sugar epimerase
MVLGKIGLTGATGMFGRHMRAALEAEGVQVIPVSRSGQCNTAIWDMTEWLSLEALDSLFDNADAIIHAGAIVDSSNSNVGESSMFDVNVRACINLAEWAANRSTPLVFISSACVYADPDSGFLPETAPTGINKLGGFYGKTKLIAEDILSRYRQSGLKLAVIRPSSLYGYGGHESKMLYKFLSLAVRGQIIELIPPVEDCIDFLHAADLATSVIRVLENDYWCTLNVASGRPISIQELALACVAAAGSGSVKINKERSLRRQTLRRFMLDTTSAHQHLAWHSSIGIQQGLIMALSGQLLAQ